MNQMQDWNAFRDALGARVGEFAELNPEAMRGIQTIEKSAEQTARLEPKVRSMIALAVAVTLVGWVALLKGLSLLFVPPQIMANAYKSMGLERYFHLWMGVVLVLGLWIALKAFAG